MKWLLLVLLLPCVAFGGEQYIPRRPKATGFYTARFLCQNCGNYYTRRFRRGKFSERGKCTICDIEIKDRKIIYR